MNAILFNPVALSVSAVEVLTTVVPFVAEPAIWLALAIPDISDPPEEMLLGTWTKMAGSMAAAARP